MALEETSTTDTNADLFERGQRFKVVWQPKADPAAAHEEALLTPSAIEFNRLEGASLEAASGYTVGVGPSKGDVDADLVQAATTAASPITPTR